MMRQLKYTLIFLVEADKVWAQMDEALSGALVPNPYMRLSTQKELRGLLRRGPNSSVEHPLFILYTQGFNLKVLKQDVRWRTQVVLVMGVDNQDCVREALRMGANAYVQMPATQEGLEHALRGMLQYWTHSVVLPRMVTTLPETPD